VSHKHPALPRPPPGGPSASAPVRRLSREVLVAQLLPRVRHAWLVQELDGGVLELAAEAAAAVGAPPLQLCPRANACTAERVAAARTAGHSVRGWGVRSLEVPPAAAGRLGAAWAW